jgi:hypothetical protein
MLHLCGVEMRHKLRPSSPQVFLRSTCPSHSTHHFLSFPALFRVSCNDQFTSCEPKGSRCISSCRYPSDSRHSHRPFTDSKAFTVPSAVDPRMQGSTSRRVEISGAGDSRILHQRVERCACDAGYGFFTTKI